jgi:hypothetical protein
VRRSGTLPVQGTVENHSDATVPKHNYDDENDDAEINHVFFFLQELTKTFLDSNNRIPQ